MKQKICKAKECNKKHYAKGYCKRHYTRKMRRIPIIKICKREGCNKIIPIRMQKFCCDECFKDWRRIYQRENTICFSLSGTQTTICTGDMTADIKKYNLFNKIKNDVLNDCIKNPAKYLKEDIDD